VAFSLRAERFSKKSKRIMYELIYQYENLLDAYDKAKRQKRYRKEVLDFSYELLGSLIQIQNELIYKVYRVGEYRERIIYEPKKRRIVALPFRDRIVQHGLHTVIYPVFEKRMISDSYACRGNKGSHAAARRCSYFLGKPDNMYYIKADIKSYFASINHDILKMIIRRTIDDPDVIWLIDTIIDSFEVGSGLPIGNLTSQLFANIYLHELDHYLKNELGTKYYIRYMDDMIIMHSSKGFLKDLLEEIRCFLSNKLSLTLNPKTKIGTCADGIEFVGYRIWRGYKLIKKASLSRMKKKYRRWRHGKMSDQRFVASLGSWMGHAGDTSSHKAVERMMLNTIHELQRRGT
jgi:retron-type reverse transcriptase